MAPRVERPQGRTEAGSSPGCRPRRLQAASGFAADEDRIVEVVVPSRTPAEVKVEEREEEEEQENDSKAKVDQPEPVVHRERRLKQLRRKE